MQYIFGDNRSSYAMIYSDVSIQEAQKIHGFLRFPITPNEQFNTLGFISYGTNSNCPFLFSIKKDKSISRSCYFVHGVSRDASPEYFSNGFFDDLFTSFISQEEFDVLRDGGEFKFAPVVDSTASELADKKNVIHPDVLCEVVAQLYQKNKVILTIDDSIYNDVLVRVILKQIFVNLTPSLRKSTSFLTAVSEIGNAEIMLRIVPRSMVENSREPHMDIDGHDFPGLGDSKFHDLAKALIPRERDAFRQLYFDNFEYLYSGYDTFYKKQNAEEFFIVVNDKRLDVLEKIVDAFLTKNTVSNMGEMSSFATVLCTVFKKPEELQSRFVFKTNDILKPASLLNTNNLFIYKTMLFAGEIGVEFLKQNIANACNNIVLSPANFDVLLGAVKLASANAVNEKLKPHEKYFYSQILHPVFEQHLNGRIANFIDFRKRISEIVVRSLMIKQEPIEPSEYNKVKEDLIAKSQSVLNQSTDKLVDLKGFIEKEVEQAMYQHNDDFMNGRKNGVNTYANEVVIKHFNDVHTAIQECKDNAEIERLLTDAFKYQNQNNNQYQFMIDDAIAKYTVYAFQKGIFKTGFYKNAGQNFRYESVVKKIEIYDPAIAVAFSIELYSNTVSAMKWCLACLEKNKSTINRCSSPSAEASLTRICKALNHQQSSVEANKKELVSMISAMMKKCEPNSNLYVILDGMKAFCANGKLKTPSKKKLATTKLLLIIVSVIAALSLVAATLFAFDVITFGDSDKDKIEEKGDESEEIDESSEEAESSEDSESSEEAESSENSESSEETVVESEVESSEETVEEGEAESSEGTVEEGEAESSEEAATESEVESSEETVEEGEAESSEEAIDETINEEPESEGNGFLDNLFGNEDTENIENGDNVDVDE